MGASDPLAQLGPLYDQEPIRCKFHGGPWAGRVMTMPDDRLRWMAPVPTDPLRIVTLKQRYPDPMATATYERRGIADDGTRLFYLS